MTTLILAQHDGKTLNPSTRNLITAAQSLGETHVLLCGENLDAVQSAASQLPNIEKVLVATDATLSHGIAESISQVLVSVADSYSHILAPASTYGKNILPRAAALLDVAQISDVIEVVDASTFKRPIYAGNAIATVQSEDKIKLMTVRPTAFDAAEGEGSAAVEEIAVPEITSQTKFVKLEANESDRPDLTSAKIVVSGGRGFQNGENFKMLEALADKMGAAIGASRAAVDAGYVPNDYQVGQTGKVVAPDLYMAFGISGAIQHLAGMKDSKIIVAVNKDPDAPIFDIADYGLVGDLFEVIPEIEASL